MPYTRHPDNANQKATESWKGTNDDVNLLQLFCRNNKIIALDLTKNTKLGQVFAQNNLIKVLDISNAPNMIPLFPSKRFTDIDMVFKIFSKGKCIR